MCGATRRYLGPSGTLCQCSIQEGADRLRNGVKLDRQNGLAPDEGMLHQELVQFLAELETKQFTYSSLDAGAAAANIRVTAKKGINGSPFSCLGPWPGPGPMAETHGPSPWP